MPPPKVFLPFTCPVGTMEAGEDDGIGDELRGCGTGEGPQKRLDLPAQARQFLEVVRGDGEMSA